MKCRTVCFTENKPLLLFTIHYLEDSNLKISYVLQQEDLNQIISTPSGQTEIKIGCVCPIDWTQIFGWDKSCSDEDVES